MPVKHTDGDDHGGHPPAQGQAPDGQRFARAHQRRRTRDLAEDGVRFHIGARHRRRGEPKTAPTAPGSMSRGDRYVRPDRTSLAKFQRGPALAALIPRDRSRTYHNASSSGALGPATTHLPLLRQLRGRSQARDHRASHVGRQRRHSVGAISSRQRSSLHSAQFCPEDMANISPSQSRTVHVPNARCELGESNSPNPIMVCAIGPTPDRSADQADAEARS